MLAEECEYNTGPAKLPIASTDVPDEVSNQQDAGNSFSLYISF